MCYLLHCCLDEFKDDLSDFMLLVDLNVLCELEIIRLIQTKFKSFESAKSTETNIDSENFKIKWLNFYSRDMLEYRKKSYKMI